MKFEEGKLYVYEYEDQFDVFLITKTTKTKAYYKDLYRTVKQLESSSLPLEIDWEGFSEFKGNTEVFKLLYEKGEIE